MTASRKKDNTRKPRSSAFVRSQRGVVLIEMLVAIAIFGVVSVAFLSALVTGYQGIVFSHNKTMAESLSRSALENVRKAPYPWSTASDNVTTVMQYDVVIHADNVTRTTNQSTLPPQVTYTETTAPSDLQMITVTIKDHQTGRVFVVRENLKERL